MTDSVPFQRIGVVGAGAWGTALANAAARAGRDVILWARDPEHAAQMSATRANERRLAGVPLEPAVRPTADLADLGDADAQLDHVKGHGVALSSPSPLWGGKTAQRSGWGPNRECAPLHAPTRARLRLAVPPHEGEEERWVKPSFWTHPSRKNASLMH